MKPTVNSRHAILVVVWALFGLWGAATAWGGTFPTGGTNPSGAIHSDFNNDGIQDIVVTHTGSPILSLLLGDGNGGYGAPQTFAAVASDYPVGVADFNSDDYLDVTLAASSGLYVMLNDGQGGFLPPRQISTVSSFVGQPIIAWINADAYPDIVIKDFFAGPAIRIFYGDGAGNFQERRGFPLQLPCVGPVGTMCYVSNPCVADFNKDGIPDLAVIRQNVLRTGERHALEVYSGNPDGSYTLSFTKFLDSSLNSFGAAKQTVLAFDANNDDNVDIIVSHGFMTLSYLRVFLGDGTGDFPDEIQYNLGSPNKQITAQYLNDDFNVDLALSTASGYIIGFGDGNGGFTFEPRSVDGRGYDNIDWTLASSGAIDLLLVRKATNTVTALINDGAGNFQP